MAELNARTCVYGHDECRATGKRTHFNNISLTFSLF